MNEETMNPKLEYKLATSSWGTEEIDAIKEVVDSGNFTMGKHVQECEAAFAEFVGSDYCVMVNSGSSANLLMTAALFYKKNNALKAGDEVIVPAVSWPTTYYPLQQYGLKIKFVDIDLQTLNFNLEDLEAAISKNTKAILAVNLLGNPNDFDKINEIIGDREIILLEDNCESMGATFNSKQAGTFGLMGTFSTFFSHHISTMEGGFIVTNDEELYHILLCLRAHGWTRNLPVKNHLCIKSQDPFEESFRFILPGYNLRPIEMSGAIGKQQIKKLPALVEIRRQNAKLFQQNFENHPELIIQQELGNSSWFGFSFIVKPNSKYRRSDWLKKLNAQGVEYRPIIAGNFAKNQVIQYFNYETYGDLKNATYLDQHGFFIGNNGADLSHEIELAIKALNS